LLEVIYVLECLAPKKLHADRFLPPTPVRIVINHQGKPVLGEDGRFVNIPESIKDGPSHIIAEINQIQNLIAPMSKASQKLADDQIDKMKSLAKEHMSQNLMSEISRLETLIKINKNIREDEITSLKKELSELQNCLDQARTRIDSIRLIWKGEMSKLNQLANP
jgi:ATP-dependent helicase HepA